MQKMVGDHSNPKLLESLDQHYCNNITLNKLLQSHPSVRRRWLKRVKHQGQPTWKMDRVKKQRTNTWCPFTRQGMSPLCKRQDHCNNTQCTTQKEKRHKAMADSIIGHHAIFALKSFNQLYHNMQDNKFNLKCGGLFHAVFFTVFYYWNPNHVRMLSDAISTKQWVPTE